MRKKLYQLIKPNAEDSLFGIVYDIFMVTVICISIVPLMFKEQLEIFKLIDTATVTIFVIDYLLRWSTADYHYGKTGIISYIRYPFSFMAIIDLLSILPSLTILYHGFKALRLLRLIRALKVVRVFKSFRYSKNIEMIIKVLEKERDSLLTVLGFALAYIFTSAIVIFQVEPETFDGFFDAVYWATVSLTTVGYGDIYTVSVAGRIITMLSALVGVAIVALPSGILTAGYMSEIKNSK